MRQKVVFLGTTEREYKRRDGSIGVARNVSVSVDGEGAGQIYVGDDELFARAKQIKVGTLVDLAFDLRLFRGDFTPRLADIRSATAAG